METRGRTQVRNWDESGDGNGSSSGNGTGDGDRIEDGTREGGEVEKKRKKPRNGCRRDAGNGETWAERKINVNKKGSAQ